MGGGERKRLRRRSNASDFSGKTITDKILDDRAYLARKSKKKAGRDRRGVRLVGVVQKAGCRKKKQKKKAVRAGELTSVVLGAGESRPQFVC